MQYLWLAFPWLPYLCEHLLILKNKRKQMPLHRRSESLEIVHSRLASDIKAIQATDQPQTIITIASEFLRHINPENSLHLPKLIELLEAMSTAVLTKFCRQVKYREALSLFEFGAQIEEKYQLANKTFSYHLAALYRPDHYFYYEPNNITLYRALDNGAFYEVTGRKRTLEKGLEYAKLCTSVYAESIVETLEANLTSKTAELDQCLESLRTIQRGKERSELIETVANILDGIGADKTIVVLNSLLERDPDLAPLIVAKLVFPLDPKIEEYHKESNVEIIARYASSLREIPSAVVRIIEGYASFNSNPLRMQPACAER